MTGMGLMVEELLCSEFADDMTVICGEKGLYNEIKGVTIIEAPDIVKFIDGGEVLLTGLYAFQSCSVEEFRGYIYELKRKNVSCMIFKRGRVVKDLEMKIELLKEFAQEHAIPVIEVPFGLSFQAVMSHIMERLFSEEVTLLKYYKATHDNFATLALSKNSSKKATDAVIDMLDKLVRNPVAIFDGNMVCLGTTDPQIHKLVMKKDTESFEPEIYTNHKYYKQKNDHMQYIIKVKFSFGMKLYILITEAVSKFSLMDCIAVENAVVALQYEFSRQFAVSELEKKFQNDILNNLLHGKVNSIEELQKSVHLLDMNIDSSYRVLVIGITDDGQGESNLSGKVKECDALEEEVRANIPKARVHRETEKVVVIQPVNHSQSQGEYRQELSESIKKIQGIIRRKHRHLKLKVGIGKVVDGVIQLPKSYKEANDAFRFVDVAGEVSDEDGFQMMLFSDLGIFKLLCQLEDLSMLREYVPESLQKLSEYKKPQRDDLILTLKTYLDRNQNLAKTAQDLYIHYKTAAYRIEKITKITGMDFNNANEVLAVRIGLVVYRMIDNYSKKIM